MKHDTRDDIDLLDGEWYARQPYEQWEWMRENAPVYWDEPNQVWGITRYDDVLAIEDYLLQASSDPRNAGWVNPLREDDEIVGVALHLRTAEGLTRTLSENVGDHVIGVNIVGFAPLSDEEIAEYETEEP